ncbi:hypothetical protein [Psychrobacillus sp. L4]|uniref:hypothetical protein n=1 Tax=Psychrobacillus sp. L4 TaxID=3236892 RepID=UPI0036F2B147
MFKRSFSIKQLRLFTSILVLIVIFIGAISFFLEIYPGGYSLQNVNQEKVTLIKKGLIQKEQFDFKVTTENELKVALLKNEVSFVKSFWIASVCVIAIFLHSLALYYYLKYRQAFLLILTFFILLIPLAVYVFIRSLNFIEKLLMGLISM